MRINIYRPANRLAVPAADLASDYKAQGLNKYQALDRFVQERALRPEMDADDFYGLFAGVSAKRLNEVAEISFRPTHLDIQFGKLCQIEDDKHCHRIVWHNGVSGSNPLSDPTFFERFVPLEECAFEMDGYDAQSGFVHFRVLVRERMLIVKMPEEMSEFFR